MLGALAGPRAQMAGGKGMGPIRWMGQTGFGPSGSLFGRPEGFMPVGQGGEGGVDVKVPPR